jgi:CRISPR-associated endonuclease Csy4
MTHYVDIDLLSDPELPPHVLLDALYGQLHRALAKTSNVAIAVSFPAYSLGPCSLGGRLRLNGPAAALDRQLSTVNWLGALREHVAVHDMALIPSNAEHRTLRRVQAKSNPERLRRRRMRRHDETHAQARERIPDHAFKSLALPFLTLSSASTGQRFRLFLRLNDAPCRPCPGSFNAYGLSTLATIPWF